MHADDENKVFHTLLTKDQIYVEKLANDFDDFSHQQTIF